MKDKKNNRAIRQTVIRIVLRCLMVLFTLVLLAIFGLWMTLDKIFNGPSESARDILTMSLLEPSATKWIPGLFLGDEKVEEIRARTGTALPGDVSTPSQITINTNTNFNSDEWKDYPDGIKIETVHGDTYTAHVMLIRNPADTTMTHHVSTSTAASTHHRRSLQ